MRYVITGGAGFIGSNFIRLLLAENPEAQVLNIDKMTYAANPKIVSEFAKYPNYTLLTADICDFDAMSNAIEHLDIVVNFAAESHVDRSIKDPNSFVQTNVIGVNNLLTACRENNADRFIQISTDEVYGSLNFTDRPSRETDLLNPSSPYSASKAAGEMLCMAAYKTFGQKVIITRSSNNYGPYQYPEKVIPLFISRLMNEQKVPLYGNGLNVRDWIHVEDNCKAIKTIITKGNFGEIYNIGGGNEIDNMKLTSLLLECFGKDFSQVERVADRLGHDLRYAINCAKTKKLGWKPSIEFKTGLQETVIWYKKNFSIFK